MKRVAVFGVGVLITMVCAATTAQETPQQKQLRIARLLIQPDGLHKAALANGGSYALLDEAHGYVVYGDLKGLSDESDVALLGRVTENVCKLTRNGRAS